MIHLLIIKMTILSQKILKKIGSYIGKFKNTLSNFQREISSVTKDVEIDDEFISSNKKNKKDLDKNG